ncbi:MAG: hypothetical protein ABIN89_26640 [Chitinophagaceae bacterium]
MPIVRFKERKKDAPTTNESDRIFSPSYSKEGKLDSVAQHGMQRGRLLRDAADKWMREPSTT